MNTQIMRRRRGGFGSFLGGLSLIAVGLMFFFRLQFGLNWSEMWPLFLIPPGVALTIRPLVNGRPAFPDQSSRG